MKNIFKTIIKFIITIGILISIIFGFLTLQPKKSLGTTIPVIVAFFQSSLNASISSSATSMTMVSGIDKEKNALSGYICFIIDEGTINSEFVCGNTSGALVDSMIRGIDSVNGSLEVSSLKKTHRRGASVKITNYPAIGIISSVINGTATFPNKLSYTTHPTFLSNTDIIDKKKADSLIMPSFSSIPDASTSVLGKLKTSVTPISTPIVVGDNDARIPITGEKQALAGTNGTPSSSNKYVTQNDTNLSNNMIITTNQNIDGIKTFSSIPISSAGVPTTDNQLATKGYVDSK